MTDVVYLLDVDNTLLDNDAVIEDLRKHFADAFGAECEQRYWEIFEELRRELGYADYLGALQRYRVERPRETRLLQISLYLLHYPFGDRLYPRALEVVAHLRRSGPAVVLSDGDVVFQPRKVERSGLWQAVDGEVLDLHSQRADARRCRAPLSCPAVRDDRRQAPDPRRHQGGMG